MLKIILITLLISNYVLSFIIIFVDASDCSIERYKECRTIKTKKQLFLYLIPYYFMISIIIDFIKTVIQDFIEFYKDLK